MTARGMRIGQARLALVAMLAMLVALFAAPPAHACTVSSGVATEIGPASPAAVATGLVPIARGRAGMVCASATLTLLSGNYLRATFFSQNELKLLQQGGTATIGYVASPDAAATVRFAQGATVDYMQNNLLNLLGLLGGSSADLPIHVRLPGGSTPPVGTYRDRITIAWSWYQCPGGLSLVGLCLGAADFGTGTTTIDVTLLVAARAAVLTTAHAVAWDPVNGTRNPRALPGSRHRTTTILRNVDLVPIDGNTLSVVLPTPAGMMVAFDGDGASASPAIALVEGSPASTTTLRYGGPADATDHVDFSADDAQSWTYVPVPGDPASIRRITHVRIRPQGVMAGQSALSVSVAYLVP